MPERNKLYFASDFHLGAPDYQRSREREDRIIRWLNAIQNDASEIYLMGDVFDFWFEYASVIPRGFIRLQGKLAELADSGIEITLFHGNHDMWMFDYFKKEFGISVVPNELIIERQGKKFYLHHGDGLGPGDPKYKILKKIFRSKACQWLFARLHPNLGIAIAKAWSKRSRMNCITEEFQGEEREWLFVYARELLRKNHFDYFIFGHRHLPLDLSVGPDSRYINLGEWTNFNSYAVFDGKKLELRFFESDAVPANLKPKA